MVIVHPIHMECGAYEGVSPICPFPTDSTFSFQVQSHLAELVALSDANHFFIRMDPLSAFSHESDERKASSAAAVMARTEARTKEGEHFEDGGLDSKTQQMITTRTINV